MRTYLQLDKTLVVLTCMLFIGLQSSAQTIIMSEDFGGGAIPAGWTQNGSAPTSVWTYDLDGGNGACGPNIPIVSPSASNGFMIFDSNWLDDQSDTCSEAFGSGPAPAPHVGEIISDRIDCSAYTNVGLRFYSFLRQLTPEISISVSNDGTNWTQYLVHTGIQDTVNASFMEQVVLDISLDAGNEDSVYIKWTFDGSIFTGGQGYYFWQVDDIEVYSIPDYDPKIGVIVSGSEYTIIPLPHSRSRNFEAEVINNGSFDLTNVQLNCDVYLDGNKVYADSAGLGSLPKGTSQTMSLSTPYSPNTVGIFDVVYRVKSLEGDDIPGNSVDTLVFEISDSVFARDPGTFPGSLSITNGEGKLGQTFELQKEDLLTSVSVYLNSPPAGSKIAASIWGFGAAPTVELGSSDDMDISTSTGAWYTMSVRDDAGGLLVLPAGTYNVAVIDYPTQGITVGTNPEGYVPGTVWGEVDANWIAIDVPPNNFMITFGIRANFGPEPDTSGISPGVSPSMDMQVYPNPTSGEFSVAVNLGKRHDIQLSVHDILGNKIEERMISDVWQEVFTFDFKDKPKGVYFVKLQTEDRATIKKIVLSK